MRINPALIEPDTEATVFGSDTVDAKPLAPSTFAGTGASILGHIENQTITPIWNSAVSGVNNIVDMVRNPLTLPDEKRATTDGPMPGKIKYYADDPATIGTGAQLIGNVAGLVPMVAATAFAPESAPANASNMLKVGNFFFRQMVGQGMWATGEYGGQKQSYLDQGKTEEQASNLALADTATGVLGNSLTGIPFAGQISRISSRVGRVLTKSAVGSGVQLATDWAGGLGRGELLDQYGYHQQAEQARHMDAMRIVSDVVGGTLLGNFADNAAFRNHLDQPQIDAAVDHAVRDHVTTSAPGIITTPQGEAIHADAFNRALEAVRTGKPVDVSDVPGLHAMEFITRTQDLAAQVMPRGERQALAGEIHGAQREIDQLTNQREWLTAQRDHMLNEQQGPQEMELAQQRQQLTATDVGGSGAELAANRATRAEQLRAIDAQIEQARTARQQELHGVQVALAQTDHQLGEATTHRAALTEHLAPHLPGGDLFEAKRTLSQIEQGRYSIEQEHAAVLTTAADIRGATAEAIGATPVQVTTDAPTAAPKPFMRATERQAERAAERQTRYQTLERELTEQAHATGDADLLNTLHQIRAEHDATLQESTTMFQTAIACALHLGDM